MLTRLTYLTLSNNQISIFPAIVIQELKNLNHLDLSHNELIMIPDNLSTLSNLERIDLHFNRLSTLPLTLGKCTSLTALNLGNNPAKQLPSNIGRLSKLVSLKISGIGLEYIPFSLCTLERLEYLDCSGNNLTAIPSSICLLTELKEISLTYNNIPELPGTMQKMKNLQKILITGNPIDRNDGLSILQRDEILKEITTARLKIVVLGSNTNAKNTLINSLVSDWEPMAREYVTNNEIFSKNVQELSPRNYLFSYLSFDATKSKKKKSRNKIKATIQIWNTSQEYPFHQILLSPGTLFIIVLSPDENYDQVKYWLSTLKTTYFQGGLGKYTILVYDRKSKFRDSSLSSVQVQICSEVSHVHTHLSQKLKYEPKSVSWFQLESIFKENPYMLPFCRRKDYLNYAKILQIDKINDALNYLRDCGNIIYWSLSKSSGFVITNPLTVFHAIFKLLNTLKSKQMVISLERLVSIWRELVPQEFLNDFISYLENIGIVHKISQKKLYVIFKHPQYVETTTLIQSETPKNKQSPKQQHSNRSDSTFDRNVFRMMGYSGKTRVPSQFFVGDRLHSSSDKKNPDINIEPIEIEIVRNRVKRSR